MVSANITWATNRNPFELMIPFSAEHRLEFHYGPCFYVNLFTGILCIVLGAVIWILDLRYPVAITNFFGVDPLQAESFIEGETFEPIKVQKQNDDMELKRMENGEAQNASTGESSYASNPDEDEDDDDEIYETAVFQPKPPKESHFEKRRSRGLTQRLQKPRRRAPPPIPEQQVEMDDLYQNKRDDQTQFVKSYRT